jgi:hypothetical protein
MPRVSFELLYIRNRPDPDTNQNVIREEHVCNGRQHLVHIHVIEFRGLKTPEKPVSSRVHVAGDCNCDRKSARKHRDWRGWSNGMN